ncbi:Gti1/Pac2 family-domain-containing protein [Mycena vitilis]|nr:Gti1/Pac2 family-domain-containing protein [Mycena vitilis]
MSHSQAPQRWQPPPQPPAQQPTCTRLRIRSVDDAHKIFYAIQLGLLRMVTRRLDSDERAALRSGCVYAWEERSPNTEITGNGIERFTEGKRWSPSRVRDEFLFYYEKWVPDPNTGGTQPADWQQLIKQTYSVWVETERGRRKWHLTAYFTQSTVDEMGTVDDILNVRDLQVPTGIFTNARTGKRRNNDSDQAAPQSTVARVYAAFPSPLPALAPRPAKTELSTSSAKRSPSPTVRMFEPYPRPPSRTQRQQSPPSATYYDSGESQAYSHAVASSSRLPSLHYTYPSPPHKFPMLPPQHCTRRDSREYPSSDAHERPLAHTVVSPYTPSVVSSPYSSVRLRPLSPVPPVEQDSPPLHQPQPASGGWLTTPLMPYHPRHGSPRSDYNSSGSSSSYSSPSPITLYPLYSSPASYNVPSSERDSRSLPRIEMPIDPTPAIFVSSVTDFERRETARPGAIGPCRDLAPLNSLTRLHPYRRDPTDDKALRLLGPAP